MAPLIRTLLSHNDASCFLAIPLTSTPGELMLNERPQSIVPHEL